MCFFIEITFPSFFIRKAYLPLGITSRVLNDIGHCAKKEGGVFVETGKTFRKADFLENYFQEIVDNDKMFVYYLQ